VGVFHVSFLSWGHPSTHSWTPMGVHRVVRRSIEATRRTAKLLIGDCRCWMGRARMARRAGTLRMLKAVRGWHCRSAEVAHVGGATKLAHRTRRGLLGVTL
jgi:hypothetical protein